MSSQSSRNETTAAVNGPEPSSRERKHGGGAVKRLKSRRSAAERRPVTEDELRAAGRGVTPEDALALRTVTRGICALCLIYIYNIYTKHHLYKFIR